ncbi:unnamed protein product [Amoebophrya sp. A25]|nr:unnamed protein product [Amoebophrya sp. A25]|eukprot:GSA25T00023282001.1
MPVAQNRSAAAEQAVSPPRKGARPKMIKINSSADFNFITTEDTIDAAASKKMPLVGGAPTGEQSAPSSSGSFGSCCGQRGAANSSSSSGPPITGESASSSSGPGQSSSSSSLKAIMSASTIAPIDSSEFLASEKKAITPLWACKLLYFLQLGCTASLVRFLVVLYTDLGIGPEFIGYLMCLDPLSCFIGQIFWAMICDWSGIHIKVVLSISSALGVVFYLCLNAYKDSLAMIFIFVGLAAFCRAGAQGIQDSLCLGVLKQHKGGDDSYGGQRMWGAIGWGVMAFFTGGMIDEYGTDYMFYSYSIGTSISIAVLVFFFADDSGDAVDAPVGGEGMAHPTPGGSIVANSALIKSYMQTPAALRRQKLLQFKALWFFANLVMYGMCMAMVETFLFVYLERDFQPKADKLLLGLSIAVMCLFELPVFFYFHHVLEYVSERTVLAGCHIVFALRCLLYVCLPRDFVWSVLIVEPLHGITFAAMWTASVHYAQQNAPKGYETTMQAVCNGLYQQLGFSIGSILWGRVIDVYGFDVAYYSCAAVILTWSAVWYAGWKIHEESQVKDMSLRRKLLAREGDVLGGAKAVV